MCLVTIIVKRSQELWSCIIIYAGAHITLGKWPKLQPITLNTADDTFSDNSGTFALQILFEQLVKHHCVHALHHPLCVCCWLGKHYGIIMDAKKLTETIMPRNIFAQAKAEPSSRRSVWRSQNREPKGQGHHWTTSEEILRPQKRLSATGEEVKMMIRTRMKTLHFSQCKKILNFSAIEKPWTERWNLAGL